MPPYHICPRPCFPVNASAVNALDQLPDYPAISLRAPWAWLVANGFQDVENREWATTYRGPILIHAASSVSRLEYECAREFAAHRGVTLMPAFETLPRGGVIGQIDVVDCVTRSNSPWFFGRYGWVLAEPKELPFTACRGALRFFRPRRSGRGKPVKIDSFSSPPLF